MVSSSNRELSEGGKHKGFLRRVHKDLERQCRFLPPSWFGWPTMMVRRAQH